MPTYTSRIYRTCLVKEGVNGATLLHPVILVAKPAPTPVRIHLVGPARIGWPSRGCATARHAQPGSHNSGASGAASIIASNRVPRFLSESFKKNHLQFMDVYRVMHPLNWLSSHIEYR